MSLFDHHHLQKGQNQAPLADRLRPRSLDEFVGQEAIIGEGRLLRRAIESDRLFSSLIFYGPPGTGKTTLARLIAASTEAHFASLNAVLDGINDLRRIVKATKERSAREGRRTLLLVDEIHRWNKAQQDALLPIIEDGTITLIGATTENPYFSLIGPLLSRSRLFRFLPLDRAAIITLLERALADAERGYGDRAVIAEPEALHHLAEMADGDARMALNALELAVESTPPDDEGGIHITLAVAEESIQRRALRYDRGGDEHYDTVSAFIKSIRGSDPDAALYYLSKMVLAGEDPRFIFRRLLILAAEDVGLASPMAIVVVEACAEAFDRVGLPEGEYLLAEATLYLATAAKSDSVGAYWKVKAHVEEKGYRPPPPYLRDKRTMTPAERHTVPLYKRPHAFPHGWVMQRYLPEGVEGGWFRLRGHGYEAQILERLRKMRRR